MQLEHTANGIDVLHGRQHFTTYVHGTGLPKVILYPFLTPGGAALTRPLHAGPGVDKDHPHHRGVWTAHGAVDGVDFWEEYKPDHGRIIHKEIRRCTSGDIGRLDTTLAWVDATGLTRLLEERTMRFFPLAFDGGSAYAMELEFTLRGHAGRAIVFGDTKEGGLVAARVNPSINATGAGIIYNSEGLSTGPSAKEPEATWGKAARWVAYAGPAGNRAGGAATQATLAILHLPPSFAHPTRWHVRGYGLFAANPFALSYFENKIPGASHDPAKSGAYTLPAGEALHWRCVVIAADGRPSAPQLDAWHGQFAAPAKQQ